MLACGGVDAGERLALRYPGWTFYLELDRPRLAADGDAREAASRRGLTLSEDGLRLPLGESGFLRIEATLVEWRENPAVPETARYALRAGVGVGVQF
jgi:hypothetical protein